MIRSSLLNYLKMLQCILYRFHFLRCRMLPRLFQFFYRIRSIIHRQSQISLYLCDICGMYFEAVFSFYVLLYHFVGHSFLGLVLFGSFNDIIKRNFSLTLAKLNFYVDMSVWLFVGKQYYRLNMARYDRKYVYTACSFEKTYRARFNVCLLLSLYSSRVSH